MAATEKRRGGDAGAAEYVDHCVHSFNRINQILVDDHPNGYPQLAAFMDSDSNFLMCRRFGFLHSRVLLYRQDELTDLENKLIDMDGLDKDELPLALRSRKIDDERNDIEEQYTRKTLINTIDQKLKEYDDIVRRVRSFVSMKRPSKRNFKSFYDWILGIKPLSREETDFVKHGEDFVALADAEEGGWFDGVVEDCLSCLPGGLAKKLLTSPEQLKKSDDAYVHLYSKYRVDVIVRLTLTIITVLLLMAPTAALYLVHGHAKLKIVLIVIFTLLFSLALGVFTKAKRHEMFAATAA
ncbi:hypothetical protein MMC22_007044 [Lobaria immixta]|nr:hypothetical protein [Lobaria immixta]